MNRTRALIIGALATTAILVVVAIPALLAAADAGLLDGAVRSAFTARTHRTLRYSRLHLQLLSATPSIEIEDLVIGSPPDITPADFVHMRRGRMQLRLSPLLVGRIVPTAIDVSGVDLHMVRLSHARNNYSFGGSGGLSSFLHAVGRLSLTGGQILYEDPERSLTLGGAATYDSAQAARPLHLMGGGIIRGEPYTMDARGAAMTGRAPGAPYAFDADLKDGDLTVHATGTSQAPFDFRGFDLAMQAAGPNLADLGYLFNSEAPNSPRFSLTARAMRTGHVIHLQGLKAQVGGSDVAGEFTSDHSHPQRLLSADFHSTLLRAEDLAVLAAPRPPHGQARTTPGVADINTKAGPLQSKPFPVDGMRKVDLAFHVRTAKLTGLLFPLYDVSSDVELHQGRLEARVLGAGLAPGQVKGTLVVDASGPTPAVRLNATLRDASLDALRPSLRPTLDGKLDASLHLNGTGGSTQAVTDTAAGEAEVRVHDGAIQRSKAAALGGDPLQAAWLGLGDASGVTPLRCARAVFALRNEVLSAEGITITSGIGATTGAGRIDLRQGQLDLTLTPAPRSRDKTRISPPIRISGPLAHPKVTADVKAAIGHAGLAGIATVLTTPFRAPPTSAAPAMPCPAVN